MSRVQKKFQKKKNREREVRKKVLSRREALREPAREERAERRKLRRVKKLKEDMGSLDVWAEDVLMKMNDKTLGQLEKNAKILKALEEEYLDEIEKKRDLNNELEGEGLSTLNEKLNYLHNKLFEEQQASNNLITSELEEISDEEALDELVSIFEERCAGFGPSTDNLALVTKLPPKKDVAEVEVVKAKIN